MAEGDFLFRNVEGDDRNEVMSFTEQTWAFGDYIHLVWDEWLADSRGRFLAAVERSSGRIAGIDKLSFFSRGEAWFEGMRVHPDFRDQGLAAAFQRHMLAEAWELGAKTVRFLTLAGNTPIHRIAYRDGFSGLFAVRHWQFSSQEAPEFPETPQGLALRPATVEEAAPLYNWWEHSASSWATSRMLHHRWTFRETSQADWKASSARGNLLVDANFDANHASLPPALALVEDDTSGVGARRLSFATVAASRADLRLLADALVRYAFVMQVESISGLLPDGALLYSAFSAAGFQPDPDEEVLVLFETWL